MLRYSFQVLFLLMGVSPEDSGISNRLVGEDPQHRL